MKTIDLVPPKPSEGISLKGLEAYYAARGIQVRWRAPQPVSSRGGNALKLPDVPLQECPGCKRSVARHDRFWRRARMSMGRLGRFMDVCRRCEDERAGYTCRECQQHRRQSQYRVVSKTDKRTSRSRTCLTCEQKAPEERPVTCSRCGTIATRANTHRGWCKPCQAAAWKPKPKPRTCLGCAQERPRGDFPVTKSGRARRYCNDCVEAAEARTEKECFRCHSVKSIDQFPAMVKSVDGRRGICSDCHRTVAAHKMRKVRKRARIAP